MSRREKIKEKIVLDEEREINTKSGTNGFELIANVKTRKQHLYIGSRNPFAIADIKSGGETRGWKKRSFKENQELLSKYLGLSYDRLFDPVFGSCLFGPKVRGKVAECYKPDPDNKKKDLKLLTGCPAIGIGICQAAVSTWDLMSNGKWSYEYNFQTTGPLFDDPVQGPIPDCYLISALSSLAWCRRINARQTYNIGFYPSPTTSYTFGLATNKPAPGNTITLQLPLTSNRTPAGAKSKDTKEIWVPYYEKAYAGYLEKVGTIKNPPTPDRPQICLIPEGDPCSVLTALTGQPATNFPMVSSSTMVLTQLQALCQPNVGTASQQALVVGLAYTYCTSNPDELKQLNPPVILDPVPDCAAPRGVLYNDDLLVASHTYSLLGLHNESGNDYVILRNPYGMNCGLDLKNVMYDLARSDLQFDLFSYPLFDSTGVHNGVFALKIEDFVKWFRGFCWVI